MFFELWVRNYKDIILTDLSDDWVMQCEKKVKPTLLVIRKTRKTFM